MKKILLIFLVFVAPISQVGGYTSDDIFNLYIYGFGNSDDTYNVPEGKDLIITKVTSQEPMSVDILDSITPFNYLASLNGGTEQEFKGLVVKDTLHVIVNSLGHHNFSGFLVNEGESIEQYLEGGGGFGGWNKNIFTKEDIDFIYLLEWCFFTIIFIVKFFEHILKKNLYFKLF